MKGKKNRRTLICFLLDRSGSMNGLQKDVIGGVNETLRKQKELKEPCMVSFTRFDSGGIEKFRELKNLESVEDLTTNEFQPRGSTPLLDAIGETILATEKDIEAYDPAKTIMVIVTDGQENASSKYTKEKLKELIGSREGHGWAFLYLGANVDSFAESAAIGINNKYNVSNYTASPKGTVIMYSSLSDNLCHMRATMMSTAAGFMTEVK